jgi:uncharacterized membrane protein YebE (DUF533 family)
VDEARLLEGILRGVLGGGGRRRGHRTLDYLTGSRGGSVFTNPQVLMTAAGLAWGLIETLQGQVATTATTNAPVSTPAPATAAASLPPLPAVGGMAGAEAAPSHASASALGGDALRLVRLAVSAAHADGAMNDAERAVLERAAVESGAGEALAAELAQPVRLAAIVAGVEDPAQRVTLYGLAFAVARADEQVGGAERIYLAQLAHLLGLDAAATARIEAAASTRIDNSTGGRA